MKTIIRGKNMEITEALRHYLNEKLERLDRISGNHIEAEVELSSEKNKAAETSQVAQITILCRGMVLRAEGNASVMHAAIDEVIDKLERLVERSKKRFHRRSKSIEERQLAKSLAEGVVTEEPQRKIVEVKQFPIKPMDPEEAADEMELLGHDFFIFINALSSEVNVLYRRNDGNYGLIEPELT